MVFEEGEACPLCGGNLRYYDTVSRIKKTQGGKKNYISVRRLVCSNCKRIHREIPEDILPYCHYSKQIVADVIHEVVTSADLGYEDYPCDMTMKRWRSRYLQVL